MKVLGLFLRSKAIFGGPEAIFGAPETCLESLGSLLGGRNLFWGLFRGSGASFWGCVRAVLEVAGPVLGAPGPDLRGFLGVASSFLGSKAIFGGPGACFGAPET